MKVAQAEKVAKQSAEANEDSCTSRPSDEVKQLVSNIRSGDEQQADGLSELVPSRLDSRGFV